MVRLMGFPTRETNSSQAASSRGPAQRQTTSVRDRDEYRVGLGLFDIMLCMFPVVAAIAYRKQCAKTKTDTGYALDDCECPLLVKTLSSFCQQFANVAQAHQPGLLEERDYVAFTVRISF
jgi:hypothetical protein